jgi:sulfhydrogenase subunit beta (sulfur reductase)
MIIKSVDLLTFLHTAVQKNLSGLTDVFLPTPPVWGAPPNTHFSRFDTTTFPVLDSYRTVDPVKMLFYLTRERLTEVEQDSRKRLILGVKACDLKAMLLLDDALKNAEFVDPAFVKWRNNTLIISTDCGAIAETCHCTLVDGKPWSETGFDLNLAAVDDSFWVTAGTVQGEELLQLISSQMKVSPDTEEIKRKAQEKRTLMVERLQAQNRSYGRAALYPQYRSCDDAAWKDESASCIGCGACTNICPTCYCLILNDESQDGRFIKERSYDSCQWNGYARVAGGGTPRPKMNKRFRNRYLCKFDYMKHNFGRIGCTGCGRCTEACAGKIDFRKVVKTVENAVQAA